MIEGLVIPSFLGYLTSAFAPLGNHLPQVLDIGGVYGSPEAHTDDGDWHRFIFPESIRNILAPQTGRLRGRSATVDIDIGSHVEFRS